MGNPAPDFIFIQSGSWHQVILKHEKMDLYRLYLDPGSQPHFRQLIFPHCERLQASPAFPSSLTSPHPLITDLFHSWPSLLSSSCESWPPRPAGPPALTFLKVDCEAKLAPSPLSSPDSSNLSSVKVDRSVRLAFSPLPFPLFLKSHLCEGWPPRPAAPLFPVTTSSFNNHRIFSGYY